MSVPPPVVRADGHRRSLQLVRGHRLVLFGLSANPLNALKHSKTSVSDESSEEPVERSLLESVIANCFQYSFQVPARNIQEIYEIILPEY